MIRFPVELPLRLFYLTFSVVFHRLYFLQEACEILSETEVDGGLANEWHTELSSPGAELLLIYG
jgi:hypothetical protein